MRPGAAPGRAGQVLGLAGAILAACTTPAPVVMEGDAKSVRIAYTGDIGPTQAVAAHYCAQFELVARFVATDEDNAYYDCVRP